MNHIQQLRADIRAYARRATDDALLAAWDQTEEVPWAHFQQLATLGIHGYTIDEAYGGKGRDIRAALAILEELSRISLSLAVPYLMTSCYAGVNLSECGSEEQKRRFLPLAAKGELRFCFGLTETDAGSDLAAVATRATRATRDGDTVMVEGAKTFINGANIADYMYTLARSDDTPRTSRNFTLLLIPLAANGVTVSRVQAFGMRGGAQLCQVALEGVRIDAGLIVGGPEAWNRGWGMLLGPGLDIEKLEVAAMALGVAEAALERAQAYSRQRTQFGRPIGEFQATAFFIAEAHTRLRACRLMLEDSIARIEAREDCGLQSSMAKLFICDTCREIVIGCQATMGAYGCTGQSAMERHVRDALVFPIVGGSSAIQKNNISRKLQALLPT